MLYSSRDRKNELEGDSEIIRATIPTICLGHSVQRARLFPSQVQRVRPTLFQGAGPSLPCASDAGLHQKATGMGLLPRVEEVGLLPRAEG